MYGYPKDLVATLGPDFAPTYSTNNTFVLVYDITNPAKPVLSKDMDFEGSYVSSRYALNAVGIEYCSLIFSRVAQMNELFS